MAGAPGPSQLAGGPGPLQLGTGEGWMLQAGSRAPNESEFSRKTGAPCPDFGTWERSKPHPRTSSQTPTFNARRIAGSASCSTPLADNSPPWAHTGNEKRAARSALSTIPPV
jgi:hypothetical protein